MKCYTHPDTDAVATCTECGKALCGKCAIDVGGKVHCKECLATLTSMTPQTEEVVPINRMARISITCGLGGWLLWLLICCFNSTVGTLLTFATFGLGYLCLIPIALIPLLGWIAGVVTGHMGMRQLTESGGAERGREMALTGLISGYVGVGLSLCGCLASLVLIAAGVSVPFIEGLLQALGG